MNAPVQALPRETMRFETERSLLGGLLAVRSVAVVKAVSDFVSESDFSEHMFARLFHILKKAALAGQDDAFMVARLTQELSADADVLAAIGWTPAKLIGNCILFAVPPVAIPATARTVRFQALSVALNVATEEGDLEQVQSIGAAMQAIENAQYAPPPDLESVGSVVEQVLAGLSVAFQAQGRLEDFAKCNPSQLGRMIGGWRRKRYYVIAGRPGMGKTTLALSALRTTALAGHGVLLFSMEMGKDEVTEMMLCDIAWHRNHRIEYRDINSSNVMKDGFEAKYEEVMQVAPLLNSAPLYISDKAGLTIADIRTQALDFRQRLAAVGKRLDVICVDHLGWIKATGNYRGNKVAETEEVSQSLKQLAKDLDCAVVALCQLSRGTESRDDKRPTLSDLRWSGGIEQDADVVLMVYREEYYLKKEETDATKEMERQARLRECKNTLQVFIEKQRGGPTGEVKLFCDVGCAVVRNLEGERS